jgi:acyl-coenzyme A thioesterase PaaI-like protein
MSAEELDPHLFGAEQPCFGCGPSHPTGFRLRFVRAGEEAQTRFVPDARYQGPPGVMHGGLVVALADELAAWTIVAQKGRLGFTVALEGRLVRAVRIGEEVLGRGRLLEDRGRVLRVGVTLEQGASDCYRGTFTFVLLDRRGAERLLGTELPASWQRFCRDG